MSIWGTIFSLADDHHDYCPAWADPPGTCTGDCPGKPYTYRASHILPAADDPRGGYVGLAEVPPHITRDGRDDGPEDGITPWPWLRLSLEGEDVVLDERQARSLRDALTGWLDSRQAGSAADAPAGQPDDEAEVCGSDPPADGPWGDCWCTLPPDHEGDCLCGPCAERHGAPGWNFPPEPTEETQ